MSYTKTYLCDDENCDRIAIATCPICEDDVCGAHGNYSIAVIIALSDRGIADPPPMSLPDTGQPEAAAGWVDGSGFHKAFMGVGHVKSGTNDVKTMGGQAAERRICNDCFKALHDREVTLVEVLREAVRGATEGYRAEWSKKALTDG